MPSSPSPRHPRQREVWYVRDLWADKTEFVKCSKAESLPRHLDKHDGFACVPYKSRPVIVFMEDFGRGAYVCRCSSENEDGTIRGGRVRIGDIGLGKRSCLLREPPSQYPLNFFGDYCCEAPRDVCQFVWAEMKKMSLRGIPQHNVSKMNTASIDDDLNVGADDVALDGEKQ